MPLQQVEVIQAYGVSTFFVEGVQVTHLYIGTMHEIQRDNILFIQLDNTSINKETILVSNGKTTQSRMATSMRRLRGYHVSDNHMQIQEKNDTYAHLYRLSSRF